MKVVYFAEHDGLIKIGTTENLRQRLSQLRASLLGAEPGSHSRERELHKRFASARVEGEWFAPSPELTAYIAGLPPLPDPVPKRSSVLTPQQVADLFAVTPSAVVIWADEGKLAHFRTPGGHRRFRREDVEAFLTRASAATA